MNLNKGDMGIPTIEEKRALDGRIFAMLSEDEQATLDFYRTQGRKFDVGISIVNKADNQERERARTQQEADAILKSANSYIIVTVGAGARSAWADRT